MNRSTLLLTFALTSNLLTASASDGSEAISNAAARAEGKKIFVARCAQCHDEGASRKLPDGTTLVQRLAKSMDPEQRLQSRLKNPQERHAVMIYLAEFLAKYQASQPGRDSSPAARR